MRPDFSRDGFRNPQNNPAQFAAPQSNAPNGKSYTHIPGGILNDNQMVGKHGYMMTGDMQLPFKMQNTYHN
ncbi:MAG: hypothetical protein ACK521_03030 [bacterium]|jgi:hypothetical protein